MKERSQKRNFCITASLLVLFALWTVAICYIDVQAIGPRESVVGFAALNGVFHELTGVHISYPSSTTMLVMCVMPTAMMQFNRRIKNIGMKRCFLMP